MKDQDHEPSAALIGAAFFFGDIAWIRGLNARGSNAANGLSRADVLTSISALVVVIMRALCIARALASKKPIAIAAIPAPQSSHAARNPPFQWVKGEKTGILDPQKPRK